MRGEILAAADAALRERPFRELSVEELMRTAGLTRTLFYRHFDDLGDLVVKLLEEAGARLFEQERSLVATGRRDPEDISSALQIPVEVFAQNGPLLRGVAEAASYDERIEQGWLAIVERFAALIEAYLIALEGTSISNPHETARALNLMNVSYLLDVFGSSTAKVDSETALTTLTEIWVGVVR